MSSERTSPSDPHDASSPTPETAAETPAGELSSALAALVEGMAQGNRSSLARAISVVENERAGFQDLLHTLLSRGRAGGTRVGITGPPGAGKSSLVSAFARLCRRGRQEVGIVAVDPTAPYSGGALLGDRIRMNDLATDPGIFIRSMASRGSLGGLATTTKEVMDVMDAFGFPRLLVETVGVGQTELEITGAADAIVVVLTPESGDGIQAMKAGLMEIADVFVVNKADRPGADRLVKEIRSALKLRSGEVPGAGSGHHGPAGHHGPSGAPSPAPERKEASGDRASEEPEVERWVPPVLLTMGQTGEGVEELVQTVDRHREWLEGSGELDRRRRRRTADRIRDVLDRELKRRVRRELARESVLAQALDRIARGEGTPYSEAAAFLELMGVDPAQAPLPAGGDGAEAAR